MSRQRWTVVLGIVFASSTATRELAPTNAAERGNPYRVLILSVEKYQKPFGGLFGPHQSASKLETSAKAVGYQVTVLRDGEATPEAVDQWIDNCGRDKVRLAILAFTGHGLRRDDRDVFITVNATKTAGGIHLDEVEARAREKRVRLLGIFDCCREDLGVPKVPAVEQFVRVGVAGGELATRGVASAPSNGGEENDQEGDVLWLYATTPGLAIRNQTRDVLAVLADGLSTQGGEPGNTKQFAADPSSRQIAGFDDSQRGELKVQAWFAYAISRVIVEQKLDQQPLLGGRSRLLRAVVAHVDPLGPGSRKEQLVSAEPFGVDLLRLFRPQHGDYTWRALDEDAGLMIFSHADDKPYLSGYVTNRAASFKTDDKAMFVELALRSNAFAEPRAGTASIGLDVKLARPPQLDRWVNKSGEKTFFSLPHDRVVWCKVSLRPGDQFNYLGFSDLPAGTALEVRRAVLADAKLKVPAADDLDDPDLLGCWWLSTVGRDGEAALSFATEVAETTNQRVLKIGAGKGWLGGSVSPSRFSTSGDRARFEIENLSDAPARVFVELKDRYTTIGSANVKLQPGRNTAFVDVERDGTFDFLAVTAPTAAIRLHEIKYLPRAPEFADVAPMKENQNEETP